MERRVGKLIVKFQFTQKAARATAAASVGNNALNTFVRDKYTNI